MTALCDNQLCQHPTLQFVPRSDPNQHGSMPARACRESLISRARVWGSNIQATVSQGASANLLVACATGFVVCSNEAAAMPLVRWLDWTYPVSVDS